MHSRQLGRSAVTVSSVSVGTAQTFDTESSRADIVDEALTAGVTLFDTSPMYGRAQHVLAGALGNRRDEAQIADKVWSEDIEEARKQAETSLRLFGHIDLYQIHNLVGLPDALRLAERLKRSGDISLVGLTHFRPEAFPQVAQLMRSEAIDAIQIPYNPLLREAEAELLPLAEERGIGVIVMSPLKQARLLDVRVTQDELGQLGVTSWPAAVIRWILDDARVHSVLTASGTLGHITANAAAGDLPAFDQERRALVEMIARRVKNV